MRIAEVISFCIYWVGDWRTNWAWGLPLIVMAVLIHVLGLSYAYQKAVEIFSRNMHSRQPTALFAVIMSALIFVATALHGAEASIWALFYLFLGARPDYRSSMLFSLGAMTTFGNGGAVLEDNWRLMGSIEALCGWLLFGLTTAFLFATIQKCQKVEARDILAQSRTGRHN
jgi:hypothetical protein